jgi:hypothetical protein
MATNPIIFTHDELHDIACAAGIRGAQFEAAAEATALHGPASPRDEHSALTLAHMADRYNALARKTLGIKACGQGQLTQDDLSHAFDVLSVRRAAVRRLVARQGRPIDRALLLRYDQLLPRFRAFEPLTKAVSH